MDELTRKAFNWRISDERFNAWLDAQSNRTAALEYLVDVFQRKYGNVDILQPRRQYAIEVELGLEIDLAKNVREKNQLLQQLLQTEGLKLVRVDENEEEPQQSTPPVETTTIAEPPLVQNDETKDGSSGSSTGLTEEDLNNF